MAWRDGSSTPRTPAQLEAACANLLHASQHAPGGTDPVFWLDQEFPGDAVDTCMFDVTVSNIAGTSGTIFAALFKPPKAMTVAKVSTAAGGTGATAQTLSRLGLARVDSVSGSLTSNSFLSNAAVVVTPLAETLSNLNIWSVANGMYSNNSFSTARGLAASVLLDPAQWYAALMLQVAGTGGNMRGVSGLTTVAWGTLPLKHAALAAQSDLPTTQFTLTAMTSVRGWARFHA